MRGSAIQVFVVIRDKAAADSFPVKVTGNEANSVVGTRYRKKSGKLNSICYCIRKCEISVATVFYFKWKPRLSPSRKVTN